MENPPFEDVFLIGKGEFPLLCQFTGVDAIAGSLKHCLEISAGYP